MTFLLKHIWLVPLAVLILFRDSIFGLSDKTDNGTGATDGRTETQNPVNDSGASLDSVKAKILADRLYQAMNTAGWTDLETIWEVFKQLKNRADYNKVHNAFGLRQYDDNFGNVGWPWSPDVDLTTWLESELSQTEKNKLANDFPNIDII